MNVTQETDRHDATMPPTGMTIDALVDETLLDRAFEWLVQRRKDWPPHADVWRFRRDWHLEKARLRQDLLDGTYQMGLLDRITLHRDGEAAEVDLWPARDAVVMKALAWLLEGHLPLSPGCMHVKGHGGLKATIRQVFQVLPQQSFVLKTDVKSYYASIDHQQLLDRLAAHITDVRVLNLMGQYLRRCAERGGLYWKNWGQTTFLDKMRSLHLSVSPSI